MTKMKYFIASLLFLSAVGTARAAQVSEGAFPATMLSSGIVVAGQATLVAVQCSTPSNSVPFSQFVQFFDTGTNIQSSMNQGNIYTTLTGISTQTMTPALPIFTATGTVVGNLGQGYSWADLSGVRAKNGIYYYLGGVGAGGPVCTVYWRREDNN